jgi:hypothetical protein
VSLPGVRDRLGVGATAAVLPSWVVARLLVVGAIAFSRYLVDELRPALAGAATRAHEGLLAWDASWYARIAEHGYAPPPNESLRFFPLVPMVSRGLADITPFDERAALVIVANASAFALGLLLFRLARLETGDPALARRSVWLLALAPAAYVLVMGYTEATATALAVATFLGLRTRRGGWAAVAGALAGAARPVGILLVVPAAVEAARGWRGARRSERWGRVAAVVAPAAGTAAFLAWVHVRFDDWWLPFRIQQQGNLRGSFANPLATLETATRGLLDGREVGTGLHVPWAILLAVLVVVAFRRWPPAYGAYAAAMLVAGVCSTNLDSLERYALSAFPFVLVAAALLTRDWLERSVFVLSGAAMVGYAVLAFLDAAVP